MRPSIRFLPVWLPVIAAALVFALPSHAKQSSRLGCTHRAAERESVDTKYYEDNAYKIGKISLQSPFGFFFLVSKTLNSWKKDLPIHEGDQFNSASYRLASSQLDAAVERDSTFGEESPLKIAFTTGNIENCDERADHKSLDVVYYIFSTDILSSSGGKPETREIDTERSAPKIAERNIHGPLKVLPVGGYNASNQAFGGGEVVLRIPVKVLNEFRFRGSGSSKMLVLNADLSGTSIPHKKALDTFDYHLAYRYEQRPTRVYGLTLGSGQLRFTGVSAGLGHAAIVTKFRYGGSVEQGIQQTNTLSGVVLGNATPNSRYGALRFYTGVNISSSHVETIASYGLQIGGAGLDHLGYAKSIGDVSLSLRFPGSTHSPWDLQLRATGGDISGSPVLLSDRFFGGNAVASFIPGDSWLIPGGPLVRSIKANYLSGDGGGGTSFYSTNLTFGKVIKSWPLIPRGIQNIQGFKSGIQAGEDTAEGYFFDNKIASTTAMGKLVSDYQKTFREDLNACTKGVGDIPTSSPVDPALKAALASANHDLLLARLAVGMLTGEKLRSVVGKNSGLAKLSNDLSRLETLAPRASRQFLKTLHANLQEHIERLPLDIKELEQTPEGRASKMYAEQQMAHPRQVIDTLENEANIFALGLFGIMDAGRLWPDPDGIRYAYGGGVRLSVVNVNLNLGYAANPHALRSLGQGDGALLVGISYTNLF